MEKLALSSIITSGTKQRDLTIATASFAVMHKNFEEAAISSL